VSGDFDVYRHIRKLALVVLDTISSPGLSKRYEHLDHWIRKKRSARIVTARRNGIVYRLDLKQLIDDKIYYDGCFERYTVDVFSKVVKAGMTVFDIGANIGAHTFNLAQLVGENGEVYAFEPTAWAFQRLVANIELNTEIKNVTAMNIALGNKNQKCQEYDFRAQWRQDGEWVMNEAGVADFLTLDQFCRSNGVGKVGVIKLDVDGYETKILMGAVEVLSRDNPILIVEMSDFYQKLVNNSLDELVSVLDELGYRYHREIDLGPIDDVRSYVGKLNDWETVNVVCLPPEELSSLQDDDRAPGQCLGREY
jgi:FkbM family methyltransferase